MSLRKVMKLVCPAEQEIRDFEMVGDSGGIMGWCRCCRRVWTLEELAPHQGADTPLPSFDDTSEGE